MNPIDISGHKFDRLTAVRLLETTGKKRKWLCRCDCGNEIVAAQGNLRSGNTKSCGCLRVDVARESFTTHGMSSTQEHKIWEAMRERCFDKNNKRYRDYGGRGITVCARWRSSFEAFYADMGPRPSRQHSIERRDTHGNYEPGNCRWATAKEQQRNRRNNRLITIDGHTLPLAAWCETYGVSYDLVRGRLVDGWPPLTALTHPKVVGRPRGYSGFGSASKSART